MSPLSHGLRSAIAFAGLLATLATSACVTRYDMDADYPEDEQAAAYTPGTSANDPTPPAPVVAAAEATPVMTDDSTPAPVDPNDAQDTDPSALATFEPALSPYGTWYDDATYGTIWVPSQSIVGTSFSPYLTGGHWDYTDEGYYWASDWDWGWAPFHYGRWLWTDGYGWGWIPGATYSPAWVDWRYGDGWMGWGPMYPTWYWQNGVIAYGAAGPTPYVFCPSNQLFARQPSLVVAGRSASPGLVASTKPYTPPARTPGAARPFIGPDPKVAGIPAGTVKSATRPVPQSARPEKVAWRPAAASRIAPLRTGAPSTRVATPMPAATAPVGRPGMPTPITRPSTAPTYAGRPALPTPVPRPSTAPTYAGRPAGSPPANTYRPPTYSRPPASTYRPPTTYSRPPAYTPPTYSRPPAYSSPSYSRPPAYSSPSYSRPPSYSPPTSTYRPPSYSAPNYGSGFGGARPTVKPSNGGMRVGGGGGRRR